MFVVSRKCDENYMWQIVTWHGLSRIDSNNYTIEFLHVVCVKISMISSNVYIFLVLDASVKSPIGVEYGNEYQFGNFDQCMKSRSPENEIEPKYCLVHVNLDWHELMHVVRRNEVSH